jgi:hypothetical protein
VFKKLLSYLLALGLHLVELGVEDSQISLVALNLSQVGLVLFKVAFDFLLNFGLLRLGLPQLLMQVLHLELVQLCSRFRLLLKYASEISRKFASIWSTRPLNSSNLSLKLIEPASRSKVSLRVV